MEMGVGGRSGDRNGYLIRASKSLPPFVPSTKLRRCLQSAPRKRPPLTPRTTWAEWLAFDARDWRSRRFGDQLRKLVSIVHRARLPQRDTRK
jgi:hypothetical protein